MGEPLVDGLLDGLFDVGLMGRKGNDQLACIPFCDESGRDRMSADRFLDSLWLSEERLRPWVKPNFLPV